MGPDVLKLGGNAALDSAGTFLLLAATFNQRAKLVKDTPEQENGRNLAVEIASKVTFAK